MNKWLIISLIGGLALLKPKRSSAIGPGTNSGSTKPFMIPPVNPAVLRSDPAGGGCYLCSRSGGRKHKGIDLKVNQYQDVVSPIDGIMNRHLRVYANDQKFIGCQIIGTGRHQGLKIKLFYMIPADYIGQAVRQGEYIGYMQAISEKYPGQNMLDHIHIEVYANNVLVDPGKYIQFLKS